MQIDGKKINLRTWQEKDATLFRYWNNGKHKWKTLDAPYYNKRNEKEVEEYINKQPIIAKDKYLMRLFIVSKTTDDLLGCVSCYWQSKETNWLSIGIIIYDEAKWGLGLGYEALCLWINYLFAQDKSLVRLDLRTWSGNRGMMALSKKLGFQEEACFRKARIVNQQYFDSLAYGILRSEWEKEKHNQI